MSIYKSLIMCRCFLPLFLSFFFLSSILPRFRPETLAFLDRPVRASLPVAPLLVDLGAPPAKVLDPAGVYKDEEDNDDAKGQARVERGAERHGVLGPPGVCAALDEVVEEEADEGPDGEVEPRGGGDPAHGAEDDGQVDFAEEAVLLAAAVEPQRDG